MPRRSDRLCSAPHRCGGLCRPCGYQRRHSSTHRLPGGKGCVRVTAVGCSSATGPTRWEWGDSFIPRLPGMRLLLHRALAVVLHPPHQVQAHRLLSIDASYGVSGGPSGVCAASHYGWRADQQAGTAWALAALRVLSQRERRMHGASLKCRSEHSGGLVTRSS